VYLTLKSSSCSWLLFLVAEGFIHYRQKPGNGNSSAQNSSPDTNSLGNPKHGRGTPDSAVIGTSKIHFTYEELSQITEGFCKSFVVGEGGFGCVYKGILFEGKPVAIKQLKSVSAEGYREFKAEVEIISRVHHRHLVSLVGYCISEQHRFLIYEFVPNNTLDYHLHGTYFFLQSLFVTKLGFYIEYMCWHFNLFYEYW